MMTNTQPCDIFRYSPTLRDGRWCVIDSITDCVVHDADSEEEALFWIVEILAAEQAKLIAATRSLPDASS